MVVEHLLLQEKNSITIALAQISVIDGDIISNIKKHCDVIETTGKNNGDFVIFPELSLTGYELDRANQLAFSIKDERLIDIQNCCINNKVNAVVGAPVRLGKDLFICSLIFFKDGTFELYTKHFLHPGEEHYFIPGDLNPKVIEKNEIFSFAICADSSSPIHSSNAYYINTSVYITSALLSTNGYENDTMVLQHTAKYYNMTVLMANYCGETGGYKAAGGSCAWNSKGKLIGKMAPNTEGLLIIECTDTREWLLNKIIAF